jgi:hypothetical protein
MRHGTRPFDAGALLDAVRAVEERAGIAPRPAPAVFVRVGHWLVERGHLRAALVRGWSGRARVVLPHFSEPGRRKAVSRLLRELHPLSRFPARAAADVVCVRRHLRAFYLGGEHPLSVKTPLAPAEGRPALAVEVEARTRVERLGTLDVPRLVAHDLAGPVPWLSEEVVFGRRVHAGRDAAAIGALLGGPLARTWERQGLSPCAIADAIETRDAPALLEHACARHVWPAGAMAPGTLVARGLALLADARPLVSAPGHGDLGLTNLLLARDGRLFVLDWEHARPLPVLADAVRLLVNVPGAPEALRPLVERAAARHGAMLPFDQQFGVAVLGVLLRWARQDRAAAGPRAPATRRLEAYLGWARRLLERPA